MKTHNLKQGSKDWHDYRAKMLNASDASAMMGICPHKTRTQLLDEMCGVEIVVSDYVQKHIFDKGHDVEAAARPIMEALYRIDLSPCTMSEGEYSYSSDGITFCGGVIWEHKQWNSELAIEINEGRLPEQFMPQCQQGLMVSGAEKLVFTMSDGTANNMVNIEVHQDKEYQQRLVDGWGQFKLDRENHKVKEVVVIEKTVIADQFPLPILSVSGSVNSSNLPEVRNAVLSFAKSIKTELVTDQDFYDAEANVKYCKTAEKRLKSVKEDALNNSIEVKVELDLVDEMLYLVREKRLFIEKLIKAEKQNRKFAIINAADAEFYEYLNSAARGFNGMFPQLNKPDFVDVIKGKRSITLMEDAISVAMAGIKININATEKKVNENITAYAELSAGFEFLFSDLNQFINNEKEAFIGVIKTRISDYKVKQEKEVQARIEAEKQKEIARKVAQKAEAERKDRQAIELANQAKLRKETEAVSEKQMAAQVEQIQEEQAPVFEAHRLMAPPITLADIEPIASLPCHHKMMIGDFKIGENLKHDLKAWAGYYEVEEEVFDQLNYILNQHGVNV